MGKCNMFCRVSVCERTGFHLTWLLCGRICRICFFFFYFFFWFYGVTRSIKCGKLISAMLSTTINRLKPANENTKPHTTQKFWGMFGQSLLCWCPCPPVPLSPSGWDRNHQRIKDIMGGSPVTSHSLFVFYFFAPHFLSTYARSADQCLLVRCQRGHSHLSYLYT
jgi:hypothetical protein